MKKPLPLAFTLCRCTALVEWSAIKPKFSGGAAYVVGTGLAAVRLLRAAMIAALVYILKLVVVEGGLFRVV